MRFDWTTPNAIEKLKEMFDNGQSFLVIADSMTKLYGQPLTRNAAIGKAQRLGFKRSDVGLNNRQVAGANARAAGDRARRERSLVVNRSDLPKGNAQSAAGFGRETGEVTPPSRFRWEEANPEAKPWTSRAFGECCWPVGEPAPGEEQLSCCIQVDAPPENYCRKHKRLSAR